MDYPTDKSHQWQQPLFLPLAATRLLSALRYFALLPGLVCLLLYWWASPSSYAHFVAVAGMALMSLAFAWTWQQGRLRQTLLLDANNALWLVEADGNRHLACIKSGVWVHPLCVVLPLSAIGKAWRLVLIPGSLDGDTARLLRARLLWAMTAQERP